MNTGAVRKKASPTNNSKKEAPTLDPEKCNFRLECRRSRIQRWGVFALESIPARRRVIEYTGEKIDDDEVLRRSGRKHIYIFSISDKWHIDGAAYGSGAEFINHSCDGNMKSYVHNGHIYLSSIRPIEAGEELTYNYNIDDKDYDVPCKCGAKNCSGKMGRK